MPLPYTWICSKCGHKEPFGHGHAFSYVRINGVVVYRKACTVCKEWMYKYEGN